MATTESAPFPNLGLVHRWVDLCTEAASDRSIVQPDREARVRWLPTLLSAHVVAYDMLIQLDEQWRAAVAAKPKSYDAPMHQELEAMFAEWLAAAERLEKALLDLEQQQSSVEHAAEFRRRLSEARDSATADTEFFSHSKLVELRDAALDEHARGETLEFGAT
ncbi:MAG: hypothetical protein AB7U73_22695 [Pirellulales bacterium]